MFGHKTRLTFSKVTREKAQSSQEASDLHEKTLFNEEALALVLNTVKNDKTFASYDEWVRAGHAIYGACDGAEWGRDLWLKWCEQVPQTPGKPELFWDTIHPDNVRSSGGYWLQILEQRNLYDVVDEISLIQATMKFEPVPVVERPDGEQQKQKKDFILAPKTFVLRDTTLIEPRQWLYARHYVRKFVSTTFAPGGVGKSSLSLVECIAMASGRDLLGYELKEPLKVWYWNGEDPYDELERRIAAICKHYGISDDDLGGRLFVDSGRDIEIKIAVHEHKNFKIAAPVRDGVIKALKDNQIDVMVLDPFVSTHSVTENDNNAIDAVAKTWAAVADAANVAVELSHHTRKTNGEAITVEDGRGASSLLAAARVARVLNRMTQSEADAVDVDKPFAYFRTDSGKSNMAPP